MEATCTQDIPQEHHSLSPILCPKVWACIQDVHMWAKGNPFHNILLVVKGSI